MAGTIDASGPTPGQIRLAAGGNLTLAAGAVLDAHGTMAQLDSYGQSIDAENTASVTLTSVNGTLSIATAASGSPGPIIDVSAPAGVVCALGPCGQVILNAPRTGETSGGVNISAPGPITIDGAGSIVVNAFWTYRNATSISQTPVVSGSSGAPPVVTVTYAAGSQTQPADPFAAATAFMGAVGSSASNLSGLASYGTNFHLRPGVEIDSATPAGTLSLASDLDLSGYRYSDPAGFGRHISAATGSGEPGSLVLRAGGGLTINGSINDGFTGAPRLCTDAACTNPRNYWELAQPIQGAAGGPVPLSWSIRLVAGSDLNAADSRTVQPLARLAAAGTDGSLTLSDLHPQPFNSSVPTASAFQAPGWSVVRTGTGDLDLLAGGSVKELSTYGIYTAGTPVAVDAAYALARGTTTPPVLEVISAGTATFTRSAAGTTIVSAGALLRDSAGNTFTVTDTIAVVNVKGVTQMFKVVNGVRTLVPNASLKVLSVTGPTTDPSQTPLRFPSIQFSGLGAKVADPVDVGTVQTVLGTNGQATNNGSGQTLESLVANYRAWYPAGGGDVLISAGVNIAGEITFPNTQGVAPTDGVGNWLWRQGGTGSGQLTAWWINFGTLVLPRDQAEISSPSPAATGSVPTLSGFTGIGTLGGGNVTITAGGDIGATQANPEITTTGSLPYATSPALDVAIASTGRVAARSHERGRDRRDRRRNSHRPGRGILERWRDECHANMQLNGTLTDMRGAIAARVGSVGQIALTAGQAEMDDPRAANPLTATLATPQGGPAVVPGDATVSLNARGDLVLGGAGDPGRLPLQDLTPFAASAGASPTASGLCWFSLWQPTTAINLESAGGNLVVSTQSYVSANSGADSRKTFNAPATDNRFLYPPILTAIADSGSIYAGNATIAGQSSVATSIELAPSPLGQLELLAGQSIFGNSVVGGTPQSFDISGAAVGNGLSNPFNPGVSGCSSCWQRRDQCPPNLPANTLSLFTFEADTATGTLHAGDQVPALIQANGDIVEVRFGEVLTFSTPGSARRPGLSPAKPSISWPAAISSGPARHSVNPRPAPITRPPAI